MNLALKLNFKLSQCLPVCGVGAVGALTLALACGAGMAQAQVLGSPLGSLPAGSGPGQHSPNSAFPALPQRNDVVPWSVLTNVTTKYRNDMHRMAPVFLPDVRALHGTSVRILGYMMPLEAGLAQTHFLLTSVPLTCPFCTPGGPESMVEVYSQKPVKYGPEGVVMAGRLQVMYDDPQGLYYRMKDAVAVK